MNNEIKKYCEQCKFYSILGCQSTLICNDGNRFLLNKKTDDMQAHWIKHNEYHLNNLKNIKFENVYECSNCGHLRFDNPQGRPDGKGGKFCDECGFEMNMLTRKVINMNDIKHDWVWEYAYDRVCRKINETFSEMFEQKRKDSDERDVKIIAKINGESVVLTEPIVLNCIEVIKE